MRQVTVETVISAPREEVFDFVADLATRPAFTDHYLKDYRLARANSYGKGAAATFLIKSPIFKERGEITIVKCDRPREIVEEGRIGRLGRSRVLALYEFVPEPAGTTRVELTTFSEPKTRIDALKQAGIHRWMRRKTKTALERLRIIFEEPPSRPLARATVAGYEAHTAARFGAHTGDDPARGPRRGRRETPSAPRGSGVRGG